MRKGTTRMIRLTPWLLLGCLALAAIPGMADNISDTLTVFNPAGQAAYVLTATQGAITSGQNLFFIANPFLSNRAMVGQYTLVCEAATCTNTSSDVLLGVFRVIKGGSGEDYLGFMVPPTISSGVLVGAPAGYTLRIASGELPVKATQYLSPTLQAEGWTAVFTFDPAGTPVGEPGALVLLGSGILGISRLARRRMQL